MSTQKNFTAAELATNYNLIMNYDSLIDCTAPLSNFITWYGIDYVNKFLNNPTSIHWTVKFTKNS